MRGGRCQTGAVDLEEHLGDTFIGETYRMIKKVLTYAEAQLQALKAQGHRMTRLRKAFVNLLVDRHGPMSVQEILQILESRRISVNKTSIYREIEFLREQNLLREVDLLDGRKRYELVVEGHHHHHLVCTRCKGITCASIPHDLEVLEKRLKREHKFEVTGHVLEFFGICQRCQQ